VFLGNNKTTRRTRVPSTKLIEAVLSVSGVEIMCSRKPPRRYTHMKYAPKQPTVGAQQRKGKSHTSLENVTEHQNYTQRITRKSKKNPKRVHVSTKLIPNRPQNYEKKEVFCHLV
jgi:hypothetical protein